MFVTEALKRWRQEDSWQFPDSQPIWISEAQVQWKTLSQILSQSRNHDMGSGWRRHQLLTSSQHTHISVSCAALNTADCKQYLQFRDLGCTMSTPFWNHSQENTKISLCGFVLVSASWFPDSKDFVAVIGLGEELLKDSMVRVTRRKRLSGTYT